MFICIRGIDFALIFYDFLLNFETVLIVYFFCIFLFEQSHCIDWILLVTQCTIVLIRKNIRSIKFISGDAKPRSRARYGFY